MSNMINFKDTCQLTNKPSFQNLGKKGFLSDFEKMVYQVNYRPECPEDADFAVFAKPFDL